MISGRVTKSLYDIVTSHGCPACSQMTLKERMYGSKHLTVCSKCAVSCGPDAYEWMRELSDDHATRRFQLGMLLAAASDFSKKLRTHEAMAHNEDVCSLVRDMRDGLDLVIKPTTGAIQ